MSARPKDEFFVGYLTSVPRGIGRFAIRLVLGVIVVAASVAILLSAATEDPGSGNYGDEVTMQGVIELNPYPILQTAPDADHPAGHTVLLVGDGKLGAGDLVGKYAGQTIGLKGGLLKRGTLDMMIATEDGLTAKTDVPANMGKPIALGRWKVAGEICDGKCFAGAMRPSTGLSHKACANFCISGGQPPVMATSGPVLGQSFLLLADASGGPAPQSLYDLVALPVVLEGEIDRHGDVLVFKVDWASAKRQ